MRVLLLFSLLALAAQVRALLLVALGVTEISARNPTGTPLAQQRGECREPLELSVEMVLPNARRRRATAALDDAAPRSPDNAEAPRLAGRFSEDL